MNKWLHRIMIIAVALSFLGALLIGVGTITGGAKFLSQKDEGGRIRGNGKVYVEEDIELPSFKNIHMEIEQSDVEIRPSTDDKCRLTYKVYGSKKQNPVTYSVDGDEFTLKETMPPINVNFNITDITSLLPGDHNLKEDYVKDGIVLYLPQGMLVENAELISQSGDMTISGMNSNEFSCELQFGDITIDNTICSKADITLRSGDIKAKKLTLKQVSLKNTYGDITIDKSNLSDMKVIMENGDLALTKTEFAGAGSISINYGDVLIESPVTALADISWNMQTLSGDISLPAELMQAGAGINQKDDDITAFALKQNPEKASISINSKTGDITVR